MSGRRDRFDPLAYRDPEPNAFVIHALGPVNALALRAIMRVRAFHLPEPELRRLRTAIRPGTAAFVAPNHPEFLTDWLIDKELSVRVSPLMAHWASYEIVNGSPMAQAFWLANNLIANAPGGAGKEYSVRWALQGHGVLLHPEGTASWQAERVGPLLPGAVDMAWDACRRVREAGVEKPVYVVPIVWKLHFDRNVARGLEREIGHIERRLGLPVGSGRLEQRFAALQRGLLIRQSQKLELSSAGRTPDIAGTGYFAAQQDAERAIVGALAARYGPVDGDIARMQHAYRKAIRARAAEDPDGTRLDRARLAELTRLKGFDPDLYDRPVLTQEQIAETLKRTRAMLLTRGFAEALHNTVPRPVGSRVAHVRAPEPLAVHEAYTHAEDEPARAVLLERLRRTMQATLDQLRSEVAPVVSRYLRANLLHSGR
jgi:hypothetical protein